MEAVLKSDITSVIKSDIRFDISIQRTIPSPRVTRILVPEKTRAMRKSRNAGSRRIV